MNVRQTFSRMKGYIWLNIANASPGSLYMMKVMGGVVARAGV